MTTIANEHFISTKTVSCKVMTIKNQKGYRWYQEHWGLLGGVWGVGAIRGVGSIRGVKGVRGVLEAGRECRYSGPEGV